MLDDLANDVPYGTGFYKHALDPLLVDQRERRGSAKLTRGEREGVVELVPLAHALASPVAMVVVQVVAIHRDTLRAQATPWPLPKGTPMPIPTSTLACPCHPRL